MIELINWLICGTLLAAATHAVSLCAPRVSASLRYHLWWLALATILATPLLPMLLPEQSVSMVRAVQPLPSLEVPAAAPIGGWFLAAVWAAMAALSLTRIVIAAVVLRRRKREALPFPNEVESQLPLWNARTGARAARLCASPVVRSAAVFGGRHPAIAVSPGLLRALTPRELDLVLLHEWAHVQRYDDAANAVQQVVCSLFGMHPGVRWCARQLDLQRELACDARVVNESGSSRAYAACLARLAEMVHARGSVALAPGVLAGSYLTTRVQAVLRARPRVSRWQTGGFVTTGIAALVGVAASTAQLAAVREPVQAAAEMVANVLPQAATAAIAQRPSAAGEVTSIRPTTRPRARGAAQPPTTSVDLGQHASHQSPTPLVTGLPPEPAPDGPPLSDGAVAVPALATMEFNGGAGAAVPVALPVAPASPEAPGTWSRVADAGTTIGRKSSDAARSTAGFFSKLGKSIAGGF